jgi:phenylacetate-coenzyme A ligase PaaK-like adenylate-forming protein
MTPTQADPRYEVLASLVSEAAADSPFYRGLYRAAGIPTGRLSGEDARHLLVRLPVVGGEDLLARADEFRPETARPFRVTCSGGTVGRPKVLYRTAQDWAASTANVAELFRRAGVTGGEALLILQPLHTWGIGGLALDCCRLLGCTAVPVDPGEDPEGIAFFVRRFNAGAVFATPSLWRTFTEWAGGHGLRGPLRLLLAGERLSPEDRRHFAAYWGGGVSDLYGSEETDGLGVACPEAGGFHLLDHSFLFQVEVDGRCTPPDGPGEYTGDLVVTSLYHRGTPLIK